jgi:hypothetical protein
MEPASKSFKDHMNFKGNGEITGQLDSGEEILFSTKVQKRNKWGFNQERGMLLTTKRLYNVADEAKIQRRIAVSTISALSRSKQDGCLEFVVHVSNEYDYQFEADNRDEIFEAVRYAFWKVSAKNVPVFAVPTSLENLHTSKQDAQAGRVIMPGEAFLIRENPYPEGADAATAAMKGLSLHQAYDQQHMVDLSATNKEIYAAKGRTMTLYQRNKKSSGKEPVLEDFEAKSVIGRGAFGKVFLV